MEGENDIESIDFTKDISLFSQTTKPLDGFNRLIESIKDRQKGGNFDYFDTICRQVANRIPNIRRFAEENDVVFFVGGKKSSNGKVLFEHCREANPNTFFVSGPDEITETQLQQCEGKKIGICGATSTPLWLMVDVKNLIDSKLD